MSDKIRPSTPIVHPFYNTTFTVYRLSPLHQFPSLDPAFQYKLRCSRSVSDDKQALVYHARCMGSIFRDNGDVRGVNINPGMADAEKKGDKGMGRYLGCRWELISWPWFGSSIGQPGEEGRLLEEEQDVMGIKISVSYESREFTALLVKALGGVRKTQDKEFTYLPLLLSRMSKSIMDKFKPYLEREFDCLISPLSLPSTFLGASLEKYLSESEATQDHGRVGTEKDLHITFSFPNNITNGLVKTFSTTISKHDIGGFYKRGLRMLTSNSNQTRRKRKQDAKTEETGAFLTALGSYASETMGLYLERLNITKVACGGFLLGSTSDGSTVASGKVKVFAPTRSYSNSDEEHEEETGMGEATGRRARRGQAGKIDEFLENLIELAVERKVGVIIEDQVVRQGAVEVKRLRAGSEGGKVPGRKLEQSH